MNAFRIILLVPNFLLISANLMAAPSATCVGTESCGEGVWVSCELPIPSLGKCRIYHLPNGIRCSTFDRYDDPIESETKLCDDGTGSGAWCDPADPLYWVYCDPFALV